MKPKAAVFISLVIALAFSGPAAGHRALWRNPDQIQDVAREMEIRMVTQRHPKGTLDHTDSRAHFISFDIQTFEDFDNQRLEYFSTEHWALMIAFNLDDRPDFDRMLFVDTEPDASGGSRPYGVLTRGSQRNDAGSEGRWVPMKRVVGYVQVTRPASDAVRVLFPESMLKEGGVDRFRWKVRTVWRDTEGSEECGCTNNSFDYAPRNRMHRGHT